MPYRRTTENGRSISFCFAEVKFHPIDLFTVFVHFRRGQVRLNPSTVNTQDSAKRNVHEVIASLLLGLQFQVL